MKDIPNPFLKQALELREYFSYDGVTITYDSSSSGGQMEVVYSPQAITCKQRDMDYVAAHYPKWYQFDNWVATLDLTLRVDPKMLILKLKNNPSLVSDIHIDFFNNMVSFMVGGVITHAEFPRFATEGIRGNSVKVKNFPTFYILRVGAIESFTNTILSKILLTYFRKVTEHPILNDFFKEFSVSGVNIDSVVFELAAENKGDIPMVIESLF